MLVVGALLLSSLLLDPAPSAHAQGGAVCTFAASFRVLPGFSTTPSRGTFTCLYQFRPTEGDCVTTPARAETLTGQGTIVA